jgi:hypothetical protein
VVKEYKIGTGVDSERVEMSGGEAKYSESILILSPDDMAIIIL